MALFQCCCRARKLAVLGVGLLLAAAGCWGQSTVPVGSSGATSSVAPSADGRGESESVLTSIDDIFKLSNLGRTTAVSDGVARFNDWSRSCGPEGIALSLSLPDDVRPQFSEEQFQALEERRFLPRDGEHFRDCILERAISTYAVASAQSELDKVVNVFGQIVRAVGIIRQPLRDLPLSSYEVYLLGKGTAEDRAWIFANVVRQLRLDAVLLFPKSVGGEVTSGSDPAPFLVAALVDGRIYLFDPLAGIPIPSLADEEGDSARPRVATLAEAVADPNVLKQLDAGDSHYRIRAADLEQPRVAIVGETSLWSGRMQALQSEFTGNRAMIISDPLADSSEGSAGLWSRVLAAGKGRWKAADLSLWDYPERRLAARVKMTAEQNGELEGLLKPFEAYMFVPRNLQTGQVFRDPATGQVVMQKKQLTLDPSATVVDPDVHVNVRTTVGAQMRARLAQLEGDFAAAVRAYGDVRVHSKDVLDANPSLPVKSLHTGAIDDLAFWTGVCKFEQGEFRAAVDNLSLYRKRPDHEKWDRESRYLLALSLAANGDRPAAIRELEGVPADDPEYLGYQYLIRRWRAESTAAGE
jgi:hypothetical protein